MAEQYFPFGSQNQDRLYGAQNFRSFFSNLIGDGRCDYDNLHIAALNGLQCSKDLLDVTMVDISPGACVVKGAQYQSDQIVSLTINLPFGSDIIERYIVARIDQFQTRDIKLMIVNAVNLDTDTHLGTLVANNVGIQTVTNTQIVAYAKYKWNNQQAGGYIDVVFAASGWVSNDSGGFDYIVTNPGILSTSSIILDASTATTYEMLKAFRNARSRALLQMQAGQFILTIDGVKPDINIAAMYCIF